MAPVTIEVFLTDDALSDLELIGDYIAETDSPQQADYVLGKIEDAYLGLYELPERGVYPKELPDLRWYSMACPSPRRGIGGVSRSQVPSTASGQRSKKKHLIYPPESSSG